MKRLLNPFVLALTAILAVAYAYLAWRLARGAAGAVVLAIPFILIWLVPVLYWVAERDSGSLADEWLHFAAYTSMGWLNFAFFLSLARDALLIISMPLSLAGLHAFLRDSGATLVIAGSFIALAAGSLAALRGPRVREVEIPIANLDPALEGLRIVQITDLHVGPTIGARYVQRVVRLANALKPDLFALTGDFVDGPVPRLAPHVAPLAGLEPPRRAFFVLGNHDCYSGAARWIEHFKSLGFRVLLNEHALIGVRGALVLIGGVVDPASGHAPRPDLAVSGAHAAGLRLLLAHNPKLAPLGAAAGFDLQLSGHTHAGQFFPWTLAIHLVHAPHVSGLSRSGRMWVYVSAGTGTWGPPVRFGSQPELTLIRLARAESYLADPYS